MKQAHILSLAFFGLLLVSSANPAKAFSGHSAANTQQSLSSVIFVSKDLNAGSEQFIQKLADQGIGFLSNESLSEAQKKAEFKKLLTKRFDLKTIGRFVLGRHWRTSTQAQRSEYQNLFEEMVLNVYASRFGEYSGQALEVRGSRKDSEKDVTVNSFIVPESGSEIQVDWRVRYKNGQYRVIDVVIEGVSMAVTQRSDFSSVIQRGGGKIDVLLEHLRNI